jgi:(heptosyl)LPS beta-1,4-glucosyltransferase
VRLGGFVIHGNNVATLQACLESLRAVSDVVAAVDSGSRDGSAALASAAGARTLNLPWQGYGAARARAATLLPDCDYLFFLDADEWLLPPSIDRLRAWKDSSPSEPAYQLTLHDWVELPGKRFLFRRERHIRLIRRDLAPWTPRMIVHEFVPAGIRRVPLDAAIEHHFLSSLQARRDKEERYALLWALRAYAEGWRRKPAWPQRLAHTFRNAVVKGALFRGGAAGLRASWTVSRYHALKYRRLAELERGEHAALVSLMREGRFEDLFTAL